MKKEEIEKMDVNNPDYEYTDIVDIPNVEEQVNDIKYNIACRKLIKSLMFLFVFLFSL